MTLEETQALVSMARRTLIDYCIMMQKDYEPSWHHELIAQKLEMVERGEVTRLMLFMPPRHGKSELATKKFPAWYLGRNPDKEIICCSYSADLAEEFGRMTRDAVADEVHRGIFPECFLRKGSKSASKWRVGRGKGGFLAAGVGGSITGMGANVLLIDDPIKNSEEARSDTYRNKIWDWYTSTAFTRLEKKGAVVLVQTRWHDDDLAGRLLEREGQVGQYLDETTGMWKWGEGWKKGKWTVVTLPAIAEEDERFRKKGEALWSDKYDLEALEGIKNAIGLQDFSALYQQNPVNAEAQLFKNEWFKYWKELPKYMKYVTAVDPAISKEKRADDSVVLTLGRDPNDKYYLVEIKNFKADPSELITEIFRQQERWQSRVGVEVTQYQQALIHYMNLEQQKMHKHLNIIPVRHSRGKEDRIRGLEPFYRNGLIFHPPGGADALEDQLKRFPSGKHDDTCFVKGTKVSVPYGQESIEKIEVGDYVVSGDCTYRQVLAVSMTGRKEVITRFGITATPDHPFVTKQGIKRFDKLRESDILHAWNEKLSTIEEKTITAILNQTGGSLECTIGDTISGKLRQFLFIVNSGLITLVQFLRNMWCIIKMKIRSIMRFRILNCSIPQNMPAATSSQDGRMRDTGKSKLNSLLKLDHLRNSGMGVKRGKSGIRRTPGRCGKRLNIWKKNAYGVEKNTKLHLKILSFAKAFVGTSTEPVYNLKVQGDHTYFVNNILVHNCDALATAVYLAQKPNTGISANIMKQTGIQYTRDGKPFIPNN